jgi:hypothetical protein
MIKLITSWDDGHPLDLKLAGLLNKYDLKGTFFVPIRNCEGRDVLNPAGICELDQGFEIGSHTLDHRRLTDLPVIERARQINVGKGCLEEILGHEVVGFCYPGGDYSARVSREVQDAGFLYARTIESFRTGIGLDPFQIPVTLQLYPHNKITLIKNFISMGQYFDRYNVWIQLFDNKNLLQKLFKIIHNNYKSPDNVFIHLWGHSWEIEEMGLWSLLNELFKEFQIMGIPSFNVYESAFNEGIIS